MKTPTILICNDDGYYAEGIRELKTALQSLGRVITVAPSQDNSGVSHKITLNTALRINEIGNDVYMVDGTPVDCVHLAINGVLNGRRPDLLVSGINHGLNLGEDTAYSGTVGAAYEGFVHDVPSIAISTGSFSKSNYEFNNARKIAHAFAKRLLEKDSRLRTAVWNVNVPPGQLKGVKLARLDKRSFQSSVVKRLDPRGRPYYWIGPYYPKFDNEKDTDFAAYHAGYAAITPLKVEMTDFELLESYLKVERQTSLFDGFLKDFD